MSDKALHLLGSPTITLRGKRVEMGRRRAMALLAYLAVTDQGHSRDALIVLFWADSDPRRGRSNLRTSPAAIRRIPGEDSLLSEGDTVRLNPGAGVWVDAVELRTLLALCRTNGHLDEETCDACLPILTKAATFYRNDFLFGFSLPDSIEFDRWQFLQTETLREEITTTFDRLASAFALRKEYETAIGYAHTLLEILCYPRGRP